jgi:membrane associated rhomboid family serine protease
VIPLKDDNPTELTPWMTGVLIALNLASWFYLQGMGEMQALEQSVVHFGTRPCELTGACEVEGVAPWPSMLTSMFMHGGWAHLLGNMLFLWVFGNNIEDSMGHLRFLAFYLLCGLAASAAHVFFSPASRIPAVGASGAISGIMGAYILLYPKVKVHTWIPPIFVFRLNAFFFLAYWFVIQLFGGLAALGVTEDVGGVAVWAHVGGFVAGLVLIRLFARPRLVDAKRRHVKLPRDEVARLEW